MKSATNGTNEGGGSIAKNAKEAKPAEEGPGVFSPFTFFALNNLELKLPLFLNFDF